jgi:hypothetical protein
MSGGKRTGSGRPKLNPQDTPKPILIRAHPRSVAKFQAWRAAQGLSQREGFELLVKRLKA